MMQLWPQKKATQEMVKSEDIDYKYGEGQILEELKTYKKELLNMIQCVEIEIKKRNNERSNAEKVFK